MVDASGKARDRTKGRPRDKDKKSFSFLSDSWRLLKENKTLQLLFVEALLHQAAGNLLNLIFHDGLRFRVMRIVIVRL